MKKLLLKTTFLLALMVCSPFKANAQFTQVTPVSQMEKLDRGLIVIPCNGKHYVSWRLLGTDDMHTSFEILRNGQTVQSDITGATFLELDDAGANAAYQVKTYQNGTLTETSDAVKPWAQSYLRLTLDQPAGGSVNGDSYTFTPNDCSVGDVDGDGQYELIVKWYPTNAKDNSQGGYTGPTILDCYQFDASKANGCTRLWRINLGINMRSGAHYNQFLIYDFDGDGKAELMCKTAPGSIDGRGAYVSAVATNSTIRNVNNSADYRTSGGRINGGHEYLTVFNGQTGAAIHTIPYLPTRNAKIELSDAAGTFDWDDRSSSSDDGSYGNRGERYLATVAHLDGAVKKASGIFTRGYYTYAFLWAVDFDGTRLTNRWVHYSDSKSTYKLYKPKASNNDSFDVTNYSCSTNKVKESAWSSSATSFYTAYGQGTHSIAAGDTDGDGTDEILFGGAAISADGTLRYSTGVQHGDAHHLSDLDPDRPGLEFFMVHEDGPHFGHHLRDANTGEILDFSTCGEDNGRGLSADIFPQKRGFEYWSAKVADIHFMDGTTMSWKNVGMNFRTYWDGEPYDNISSGTSITQVTPDCSVNSLGVGGTLFADLGSPGSCNGSKDTPCLSADIFGDWREELILYDTSDNATLNIYSTVIPTDYRVPTLMHDHTYRLAVAWQNVAYNQPPHLGYFLPDYLEHFNDMSQIDNSGGSVTNPEIARTGWSDVNEDNVYMPKVDVAVGYYSQNGVPLRPAAVTTSFTNLEGKTVTLDENRLFFEDFEGSTLSADYWVRNNSSYIYTPEYANSDGQCIGIQSSNDRGDYTAIDADYSGVTNYAIEFDAYFNNASRTTDFAVMSKSHAASWVWNYGYHWLTSSAASHNAYLFFMQRGASSTTFTINEVAGQTVTLNNSTWYHFTLDVDVNSGTVAYRISPKADLSTVVTSGSYTLPVRESAECDGIYIRNGRYNYAPGGAGIDNIFVYKTKPSGSLFALDYENAGDASSWAAVSGDNLDISLVEGDSEHGKYINVSNSGASGTRSAYTSFYEAGNDPYGDADVYTLEFDARIHYTNTAGSADNALYLFGERTIGNTFSVGTNYLFKMTGGSYYGTRYTVEGDGGAFTVNDPNPKNAVGPWYHYTITVDRTNRQVAYTVSLKESCALVIASGAYQVASTADMRIQGVYVELGRTYSFFTIDNVSVSVPEMASDFAYTFSEPGTLSVTSSYPAQGAVSSTVKYDSEIGTKLSAFGASTFAYRKVGLSFDDLDMYSVALNDDYKSVELTPIDAVPAGEAVLLRVKEDASVPSDGIYAGDMVRSIPLLSGNDLIPVAKEGLTGEEGNIYVLNQVNGITGFYKLKTDGTVAYGKGYLQFNGLDVKGLMFDDSPDDDTPTGIDVVEPDNIGKDTQIYDLSGRRVSKPSKGIYIVNGRKIVVR